MMTIWECDIAAHQIILRSVTMMMTILLFNTALINGWMMITDYGRPPMPSKSHTWWSKKCTHSTRIQNIFLKKLDGKLDALIFSWWFQSKSPILDSLVTSSLLKIYHSSWLDWSKISSDVKVNSYDWEITIILGNHCHDRKIYTQRYLWLSVAHTMYWERLPLSITEPVIMMMKMVMMMTSGHWPSWWWRWWWTVPNG